MCRLRALAYVPLSLSIRLRDSGKHPCNFQSKRGWHAKRPIHPSIIFFEFAFGVRGVRVFDLFVVSLLVHSKVVRLPC